MKMLQYRIILVVIITLTTHSIYSKSEIHTPSWARRLIVYNFTSSINYIINQYFLQNNYFIITDHEGDTSGEVIDVVLRTVHDSKCTQVVSLHNHSQENNFTKLIRHDNVENSVGFIIFRNTTGGKCFADHHWKKSAFWNPQAFFLLVITAPLEERTEEIIEMLKDCWDRFNILNMEVIFWNLSILEGEVNNISPGNNWLGITSLSYNPFTKCVNYVYVFNEYTNDNMNKMFPDKLKDTNRFLIEAPIGGSHPLLFDYEEEFNKSVPLAGPNGKIFNAIIEKLNLVANISYYDTYDILDEKQDITLSRGFYPASSVCLYYKIHKSTYPFDQDCVTIIVPKSLAVPKYMSLILPFSTLIWFLFVSSNIFMAIIWKASSFVEFIERPIKLQNNVFLDSFRMSLGGSTQSLTSLFHQRFVIICILIFNLIMNNTYTGSLYSYLTVPTYLPDMNTLMEVADSDLRISVLLDGLSGVSDVEKTLDLTDELIGKVIMKILYINDDDEALNLVAFSRNISRFTFKYEGRVLITKPEYFRNGRALLHVVEECYCSILNIFQSVESHSPFLIKFNDIIVRLNEAGLVQQWNKELLNENLLISNKNSRGSNNPVVFTIDHLQAVFIILGFGLSIASIIFIVEMVIRLFKIVSVFIQRIIGNIYNTWKF